MELSRLKKRVYRDSSDEYGEEVESESSGDKNQAVLQEEETDSSESSNSSKKSSSKLFDWVHDFTSCLSPKINVLNCLPYIWTSRLMLWLILQIKISTNLSSSFHSSFSHSFQFQFWLGTFIFSYRILFPLHYTNLQKLSF